MQALRQATRLALRTAQGNRGMATRTAEETWSGFFPKAKVETPEQTAKHVRKEMIGFLLLGPIGAALMIYDFAVGLEEHSDEIIPPYPWMRIRRVPGMPWGEDALFEYHRHVATEWPLPEGAEDEHKANKHH